MLTQPLTSLSFPLDSSLMLVLTAQHQLFLALRSLSLLFFLVGFGQILDILYLQKKISKLVVDKILRGSFIDISCLINPFLRRGQGKRKCIIVLKKKSYHGKCFLKNKSDFTVSWNMPKDLKSFVFNSLYEASTGGINILLNNKLKLRLNNRLL